MATEPAPEWMYAIGNDFIFDGAPLDLTSDYNVEPIEETTERFQIHLGDRRSQFLSTKLYGDAFGWVDTLPDTLHSRVHDRAQRECTGCVTKKKWRKVHASQRLRPQSSACQTDLASPRSPPISVESDSRKSVSLKSEVRDRYEEEMRPLWRRTRVNVGPRSAKRGCVGRGEIESEGAYPGDESACGRRERCTGKRLGADRACAPEEVKAWAWMDMCEVRSTEYGADIEGGSWGWQLKGLGNRRGNKWPMKLLVQSLMQLDKTMQPDWEVGRSRNSHPIAYH
ncbi:hypothetical protein B0H13DRAFT_1881890 [Mycena leptocephala]|nr:hypothetical protein B0H13DRAFT_1881890 [Mycena leptocephala]